MTPTQPAAPGGGPGRPIRVLIGKPGLDGHDVGARVLCRALRDAGMDVTYTGLRKSPDEIARLAAEHGADVVGLSILSGAHLPLCEQFAAALAARGLTGELLWIVGGNVPEQDHAALSRLGAAQVFNTGADLAEIVAFIHERTRHAAI